MKTPTAEEVLKLYLKWTATEEEFDEFRMQCRDEGEVHDFAMDVINDKEAFFKSLEQWQAATRTENSKRFIVQLEAGVWLARWDGDPGRTMHIENSRWFETREEAEQSLIEARRCRPFVNGRVLQLKVEE